MLAFKQSFASSGFLNALKVIPRKTLQTYMEAGAGKSLSGGIAREYGTMKSSIEKKSDFISALVFPGRGSNPVNHAVNQASSAPLDPQLSSLEGDAVSHEAAGNLNYYPPQVRSLEDIIKILQEGLAPTVLVVNDVSYQHAGHAGVENGATETHFNVKVVSEKFTGNSLIKRHRLVYDLLDEELKNGVHALSLVTKSPSEPA